jgi:membrane protease YdiL (CAAX protease family)
MALELAVAVALTLAITAIVGKQSFSDLLLQGKPWPVQVVWGGAIGLLSAVLTKLLLSRAAWFDAYRRQMIELASRLDLSGFNPLWMSLCAGVGEELLFRGAVQPLAGLWLTSVIFTALHYGSGGFRTMNRWKAFYALLIFLASLGFGAVCVQIGLIAAIVTHTVLDIVGLMTLRTPRRGAATDGGREG